MLRSIASQCDRQPFFFCRPNTMRLSPTHAVVNVLPYMHTHTYARKKGGGDEGEGDTDVNATEVAGVVGKHRLSRPVLPPPLIQHGAIRSLLQVQPARQWRNAASRWPLINLLHTPAGVPQHRCTR